MWLMFSHSCDERETHYQPQDKAVMPAQAACAVTPPEFHMCTILARYHGSRNSTMMRRSSGSTPVWRMPPDEQKLSQKS